MSGPDSDDFDARIEAMHDQRVTDAHIAGMNEALKIVRTRLAYYELYRCDCDEVDPGNGHRPDCKGAMMATRPATFATLEEIIVLLEAAIERKR